jgi:hypothetical protein
MRSVPLARSIAVLIVLVLAAGCGGAAPPGGPAATGAGSGPGQAAPSDPAGTAGPLPWMSASAPAPATASASAGTILVEPWSEVIAWENSVAISPDGTVHAAILDYQGNLRLYECGTGCENAASWTTTPMTSISPGFGIDFPRLRSLDSGRLTLVIDDARSGEVGDYLAACDGGCTDAGAWAWSKVDLGPNSGSQRSSSRYFAVAGDAMIIGLGQGSPMGVLVCTSGCGDPGRWVQVTLSQALCYRPSVAVLPSGAMAVACEIADYNATPITESVHVWTCAGDCTRGASWEGVLDLAKGSDLTADVAMGPDGSVGVAINMGPQPGGDLDYAPVYTSCRSQCGDPRSWASITFPGVKLYTAAPVVAIDEAGRSVIGFVGDDSDGKGLHVATCEQSCEDGSGWKLRLLDDPARIRDKYPLKPPGDCTSTLWINRDIRDISARNGRFAISYYLGAVGIGGIGRSGSCYSEIIDQYGSISTFYSMTSIAIASF